MYANKREINRKQLGGVGIAQTGGRTERHTDVVLCIAPEKKKKKKTTVLSPEHFQKHHYLLY